MSMSFNRRAIIPAWLVVVIGLSTMFGSPLTTSTGWLLLFGLGVMPAIVLLVLSKEPTPTLSKSIAQVLHPADRSR
jgi:hypothetical protein